MPGRKWTYETVKNEAAKYKTRKEFQNGNKSAYNKAWKQGWLDDICSHMQVQKHQWTFEEVRKIALKYSSSIEMQKNDRTAWNAARRSGWWKQVSSHMSWHRKWTADKIKEEALKYETRKEFQTGTGGAYKAAIDLNILDEVCSHMISGRGRTRKGVPLIWTFEKVQDEALKYATRTEFNEKSVGAYEAAKRYSWLDQVCGHMKVLWEKKWDKESCRKEALKYKHRKDFQNGTPGAYGAARNNNWLDEICSHMTNKSIKWTFETLLTEAKKYRTRTEFSNGSGGAYFTARDKGILDEVCSHMEILHNGYDHCVYAIYNKRLNLAYIGVTTQRFEDRMTQHRTRRGSTNAKKIVDFEDTVFEQQTKYIYPPEEVKQAEFNYIEVFRSKNFKILNNIRSVGGIGYSRRKWTFEQVSQEAKKFNSRWQFQQESTPAYGAAKRHGWLDDICSHMEQITKPEGYWTLEKCKTEAAKFNSLKEFRKTNSFAYKVICQNKWNSIVWACLKKETSSDH